MSFDLADILRRTASTGDGYIAGSPFSSGWTKRAEIRSAAYVVAWKPDASPDWWHDVLFAATYRMPVIFASPDRAIADEPILLRDVHGTCLRGCAHIGEAIALAKVFWTHDRAMVTNKEFGAFAAHSLTMLAAAESPIEARMAVHLSDVEARSVCLLRAQHQVGPYRVDLAVESFEPGDPPIHIAVECDGHDFHERTKEQAARDKKRDRDLAAAGWTVLRFTGSEIWNDPRSCVDQVLAVIDQQGGKL